MRKQHRLDPETPAHLSKKFPTTACSFRHIAGNILLPYYSLTLTNLLVFNTVWQYRQAEPLLLYYINTQFISTFNSE